MFRFCLLWSAARRSLPTFNSAAQSLRMKTSSGGSSIHSLRKRRQRCAFNFVRLTLLVQKCVKVTATFETSASGKQISNIQWLSLLQQRWKHQDRFGCRGGAPPSREAVHAWVVELRLRLRVRLRAPQEKPAKGQTGKNKSASLQVWATSGHGLQPDSHGLVPGGCVGAGYQNQRVQKDRRQEGGGQTQSR